MTDRALSHPVSPEKRRKSRAQRKKGAKAYHKLVPSALNRGAQRRQRVGAGGRAEAAVRGGQARGARGAHSQTAEHLGRGAGGQEEEGEGGKVGGVPGGWMRAIGAMQMQRYADGAQLAVARVRDLHTLSARTLNAAARRRPAANTVLPASGCATRRVSRKRLSRTSPPPFFSPHAPRHFSLSPPARRPTPPSLSSSSSPRPSSLAAQMGASQSAIAQQRDKPEREGLLPTVTSPSPRAIESFSEPPTHNDMTAIALPPTPNASVDVDKPFHVLVLMSDTGGGHRASAQALDAAFDSLYPARAQITTVDFWTSVAGFPFHNFPRQYSYIAKRPWMWKFVYLWALFPPTRWLTETAFSLFCHGKVRRYFESVDPDLIISVHPLVNTLSLSCLSAIRRDKRAPSPPYVIVVTDLGGAHPTWFDPRADMVYVPSEPLHQAALEAQVPEDRLRLFGLPIRPAFWQETRSTSQLRVELGMALNIPAVLLVGGGDGVGGLQSIAIAVAARIAENCGSAAAQLVVVCGKNKSLLNRLQATSWPIPVILKGFVNNMSEWMSACDILCSKAGPGTIAEAWIRGLPIILTGFLPGQEEGNVTLVTESGSGEFHSEPDDIAECCAKWISDPELRGAVAERAKSLGRPKSCLEIASDVWEIGQQRQIERDAFRLRALSSPSQHIPNGYVAMARFYVTNGFRSLQRSFRYAFGYSQVEIVGPRE
ncbi:Monogalactosyldiacylglycerol synthase family GT28 [Gracilaria domingensis]|nr:Monogalactosyldiacylglycerol synthase family GT28 [Gracilaria domingensis]